ncbi:MAG: ketoacyl-ACP synthase III [Candidatus Gastranaerophilales bacterium]|nr:ketoacyl-ACP synthase III [Candidatus Gastranaerophilales bacterium]
MKIPVKIRGMEFSVPNLTLTNDDMAKIVETSDEWIRQRTGIAERHVVSGEEDAVTLGISAVNKLLEKENIDAKTIDMIISATSAPQRPYPSVACEIQSAIGADNASAFDLVAACSGFLYAMQMARANIASGFAKRILVLAADATSKFLDWTDRSSCVLFGDGAAATILEVSEDGEDDIIAMHLDADGKNKEFISLNIPNQNCPLAEPHQNPENLHIIMAGKDVYKFVMQKIPAVIEKTLEKANMTIDDIDYFIPHQANLRMIEALTTRIKIAPEKVLHNIEHYGNMSATSIPCVISEKIKSGELKTPSTVLLSAFGAGMTSAGAIIRLR